MTKTRLFLGLALALCFATVGTAQDEAKGKAKGKERALKTTTTQMMKAFEAAELTDEQKKKAAAIVEKHINAVIAARQAVSELLTKDQQKAKQAATKKAKEDGLKGAEATAAVNKALGLSEADMAKYKEAMKKPQEVTAKIKAAITELLTDDQKAALPKPKGKKGAAKGKGKKKKGDGGDDKLQTVSLKLPNMT